MRVTQLDDTLYIAQHLIALVCNIHLQHSPARYNEKITLIMLVNSRYILIFQELFKIRIAQT